MTSYMIDMKEKETLDEVNNLLKKGEPPLEIIEHLRRGITVVGDRFERHEVFLAELIMAAEIFKGAMKLIQPRMKEQKVKGKTLGTLILGTVQGDLHDIGKNIFGSLMDASGFEVIDLGIDVPPEKFVQAIKEHNATLVGMSALLSNGISVMASIIKAIEDAGLRDKVKILIGGTIAGENRTKDFLSADFFTVFASAGIKQAKKWVCVEE